jgi:septal ring factor EnvC (AmiA/AmiB activator)
MDNTTLIRVLGLIGGLCVVAITAILIWYPGTTSEKVVAAGIIGGLITVIGGQLLNLKQSGDNATAIEKTIKKVDDNTETTNTTHAIVNSRMDEFKQALTDLAAQKVELASQRSEIASLVAEARGMAAGREQVVTESAPAQSTVQIAVAGTEEKIEVMAPATIEVKAPE